MRVLRWGCGIVLAEDMQSCLDWPVKAFHSRRPVRTAHTVAFAVLAGAMAWAGQPGVTVEPRRDWALGDVRFSNDFSGGRLADCTKLGPGEFLAVVSPENRPINQSPWYAFKVWSAEPQTILVMLTNTYSSARGRPWTSRDGVHWSPLDPQAYSHVGTSRLASARLNIGPQPVWLSAYELVGLKELGEWTDRKCRLPFVRTSVIGHSLEGRPLRMFIFGQTKKPNYIFMIGRQHPPEVTGSLGLMSFVDTLTGSSRLARRFRREFQTVVIPLLNPDGVERGHWRSNLGGMDLNRDWRNFLQPESRAASETVLRFARQPGARPFVFVDFHSTGTNVFYAQPDGQPLFPPGFTRDWLAALHRRLPEFPFARDDGHNPDQFTSKAWASETLGIAAITWEFGYGTDRKLIQRAARVGAEEFMRRLLAEVLAVRPGAAEEKTAR